MDGVQSLLYFGVANYSERQSCRKFLFDVHVY